MNRQAVPSILLSVAIVCFFAVALYQRDPKPLSTAGRGASPRAPASRGPASQGAGTTPVGATEMTRDAPVPRVGDVSSQVASHSDRGPGAGAPVPAIRMVSSRAVRASGPQSLTPREATGAVRATGGRSSRSAFTVVGSNETIADVARRVYGKADAVDALWRANRDVVPQPGAPLSPGMMLRTPFNEAR